MVTPCENYKKIDDQFGIKVFLKREDLNPNGSHKDRSIPFMIKEYQKKGIKNFVISSSGNAAIAAYSYCKQNNLNLHIFLSPKTPEYKKNKLIGANLHTTKRAVSEAFKFAKKHKFQLLRSSKDPYALIGYEEVAKELHKQVPDATDIFIPCSSGTLAVGIYQGYNNLETVKSQKIPKIHFVQTEKINTLVREFDKEFTQKDKSIARAIVDRVGHRKKTVNEIINSGKGFGWVVNDNKILKFYELLRTSGIQSSEEGAMGLAALEKAMKQGIEIKQPVCIITGTKNKT